MAVSFRVSFDDEASAMYRAAAARGLDLRPALRSMGVAGATQTTERFDARRAPDGSSWKPSNNPYGTTLQLSRKLRQTILPRPPTATSVEWGSNRVYAAVHQTGIDREVSVKPHERTVNILFGRRLNAPLRFTVQGHARRMRIVARPYLGTNAADMAEFAAIGLRHIAAPIGGTVSGGAV